MSTDTLMSDRVNCVESKVVVVVPGEHRVTRRDDDEDGSGCYLVNGSVDSWVCG